MKKSILAVSALSVVLLLGAGCSSVSDDNTMSSDNVNSGDKISEKSLVVVDSDGVASIDNTVFFEELGKNVGAKATQGDTMALPYMYESEKMAENLFATWNEKHELPILDSLVESHATQREILAAVMGGLQVDLSVAALEEGTFKDAKVQTLYDKLLPIGNEMRVKAFTSGLLLEESMIKNVNTYLERGIDGISKKVFEAIKEASGKNLKVLNSLLVAEGATYKAQVISQSEFDGFVK
ncbi:MAG: DUF2202 domain-containing protein [Candidatus Magasanikbacteria bacterium]